jgi:acyl carrier protein
MDDTHELMANILACDPATLPSNSTPLRDINGWDSLKHVLLVVELEKRIGRQLTAEEIQTIVTLADVSAVIGRKGANG